MPLSGVTDSVLDGQLGTVTLKPGRTPIIMGVTFGGTMAVNTGKLYAGNQVAQIQADFGAGAAVQMACRLSSKGFSVALFKSAKTTAGVMGAVTFTGTGLSTVTVTGEPVDFFRIKVNVVNGGTVGTAGISIQVSLDNGETWGPVVRLGTSTSYPIPNTGVTVNFSSVGPNNTLVTGDTATARTTTEPKWASGDMTAAMDAAVASGIPFDFMQICGSCNSTEAASLDARMVAYAANKKFFRLIVETVRIASNADWTPTADATWQTVIITDFATFTSKRFLIAAGDLRTVSAVDDSVYLRPVAWHCCERATAVDSARYELGRVKDDGAGTGALDASFFDKNGNQVAHNELNQPGLDEPTIAAIGFTTARTYPEKGTQAYISEAKLFSPAGSDFSTWRLGRVIDLGEQSANAFMLNEVEETPPVNKNGTIQTAYGDWIEAECKAKLADDLINQGRAVDCTVAVDRTVNILQTKTDNVAVRILPYGESKYITLSIGFAASLPTP